MIDGDVPVITLIGSGEVTVELGNDYEDAGATAQDAEDGTLTDKIIVKNPVDTSKLGNYTVTYNVKDSSAHAAPQVIRTVIVVDGTPPVIDPVADVSFDEKKEIDPIAISVTDLNPTLTVAVLNLPQGLHYDPVEKKITGTSQDVGEHIVNIVARDGSGNESTVSFKLIILDKTAP